LLKQYQHHFEDAVINSSPIVATT